MERLTLHTLNTATLWTWAHLVPNPAQNLESRLEVVQGHAFWDR